MKRLFICLLIPLLLFSSCSDKGVKDKAAETKAIQEILESFQKALEAADSETMKSLSTDDFMAFDEGKSLAIDEIKSGMDYYNEMGMINLNHTTEIIRSEIYPDNAVLFYLNTVTSDANGREVVINWTGSCYFVKDKGAWKIKYLHTTLPVLRGRI